MFTGIIQATGHLSRREMIGIDARLQIQSAQLNFNDVQLGDSIAVNGVCLTVIALTKNSFAADVSVETLTHTTLGELAVGSLVNLEKALTLQTPLGGHLVNGHVDGVGILINHVQEGRSSRLQLRAPNDLAKYIAPKGCISIDGISLTVNRVNGNEFDLNIVPHTLLKTTLDQVRVGQRVNLEVDIIARYIERLLQGEHTSALSNGITQTFLQEHGFA